MVSVKLLYDGTDISEDISKNLESISYTDNVHGKADEISVTLENTTGLFTGAWQADKGSRLTAYIGELNCGVFSIDEIEISSAPDTVVWSGISAFQTSKMRSKKSKGFENVSLLDIAKEIASQYGLTVDDGTKTIITERPDTTEDQKLMKVLAQQALNVSFFTDYNKFAAAMNPILLKLAEVARSLHGKGYTAEGENIQRSISILAQVFNQKEASRLSANISKIRVQLYKEPTTTTRTLGLGLSKIILERSTQNRETDLGYLTRICEQYGIAFNVKPPVMVFYSIFHLESTKASLTLDKKDLSNFKLTDKTIGTYKNADVAYSGSSGSLNNKVTRATSIPEQALLNIIINLVTVAGTFTDYDIRDKKIKAITPQTDRCLTGLKTKGYLDQYQSLLDAYALLVVDRSVFACVRFANASKLILADLKSLQLEAIQASQDVYKGGQSSDTLLVRTRVENPEQVQALTKAQLHKKNSKTRTGSFTMPGNTLALAGVSFNLTGFGVYDDKYFIVSSTHRVDKSGGYTTDCEFRKGAVSA